MKYIKKYLYIPTLQQNSDIVRKMGLKALQTHYVYHLRMVV